MARFRRRRRKRKLWAWTGGKASGAWISGELIAGTTKNIIMVDEPVLSSHGLDSNTAVYRTLVWLSIQGTNGPYQVAPTFGAAIWNGLEDASDTPTNTPATLGGSASADLYARKDILFFHFDRFYGDEASVERSGGEFVRVFHWDVPTRRKVPTKGHVSLALRMQTNSSEEGSIGFELWYRNLVVADYR